MIRGNRQRRVVALAASALLLVEMSALLAPGMDVVRAQAEPAVGQQNGGASAQQQVQDDQATAAAAQQAVGNELQQTENLEFQTLNEERPPAFQQIEP